MNKSPERYTFQKEGYIKRCEEQGEEPSRTYLDMWDNFRAQDEENEQDLAWRENNLEYDLRNTAWICDKAKSDDVYAQNLYAAMCNNEFQRNDMMPILKDQRWSCSWRHAGGIIADMREQGDYIDWYCSGIRNMPTEEEIAAFTDEQMAFYKKLQAYVGESFVTDEIRNDLKQLGWIVIKDNEDDGL
jgi:hypothetical protein